MPLRIIVGLTVFTLNRERIGKLPFARHSREILLIRSLCVADFLNIRILIGIYLKASGIKEVVGLCYCISLFVNKVFHHLANGGIYVIRVYGCVYLDFFVYSLNPCIYIITFSFFKLFFRDKAKPFHIVKDRLTPCGILLRMCNWVIPRRILGDSRNYARFRKRKLAYALIEISKCGSLHSEGILPEVYCI